MTAKLNTSDVSSTEPVGHQGRMPEIDGYHDLRPIGEGGSASVYRATAADGQIVAVKVLHGLGSPSAVRRFEREAQAMTSLADIDGVVPVLETGATTDGVPYLVMPHFANGSLQDLMDRDGPLDAEHARSLVTRIGGVLAEVHRSGVYHRDLKPANVLLDESRRPWIGDFGVAQLAEAHTVSTTVSYTLGYCAPEAFLMGRRGSNGVAVDVYALAATLWALIAGRPPLSDDGDVDAGDAGDAGDGMGPRAALGRPSEHTPADVAEAIAVATDPDASRRPSSMADFVGLLTRPTHPIATGSSGINQMTVSRPGDEAQMPVSDADDRPRRRRMATALSVITVLAALSAGVAWANGRESLRPWLIVASTSGPATKFHLLGPNEEPSSANQLDLEADSLVSLTTTGDPETPGGSTVYAIAGSQAGESLAVVDIATGTVKLLAENRLDQAWAFEERAILEEKSGDGVICVAVSPQGGQRQLGAGTSCQPSPDGSHVAIAGGGRIAVMRSADGAEVAAIDGADASQAEGWNSFSPDSRYWAVRGADGVVSIADLEAGAEIDRLSIRPSDAACGTCLSWNADGALLALAKSERQAELWRRNSEPVVVDGYSTAAFRVSTADDLLLWTDDGTISMLDDEGTLHAVSDSAYWITVASSLSPALTVTEAVLIDGADIARVDEAGQTKKVAKLSAPVVSGAKFDTMQVGDTIALTFEVQGGGRDVVALDTRSGTSATWSGENLPIRFSTVENSVIARVTPKGADNDRMLVVDPEGIVDVDVAGDLGGMAGFGDDLYYTRNGREQWVDRIGRGDGEVDTVLRNFAIVAFGTARQ